MCLELSGKVNARPLLRVPYNQGWFVLGVTVFIIARNLVQRIQLSFLRLCFGFGLARVVSKAETRTVSNDRASLFLRTPF